MKNRDYSMWLLPPFFAMTLFLCIRVANDIPKSEYYWEGKNWEQMLMDVLPVLAMSYPVIFLLRRWLFWCRKTKLARWKEYAAILFGSLCWCLLTMWSIRLLWGVTLDWRDVPIAAVIGILLTFFLYAYLRNQAVQKENEFQHLQIEKIRNDQLQTELKFLKAQYHPHFLFNVLNTVYFQIDEKNELPKQTLEKLSNLLRYQLYNDGEKVPVRTEVEFLKQYISLWQLRSTKRLRLDLSFDEALDGYEVYPLLFVPLVENAFKYVGGQYYISLDIRVEVDELHFSIVNSIPETPILPKNKQGIGLENLNRRLELLYPERHVLDIQTIDNLFSVKLILKL